MWWHDTDRAAHAQEFSGFRGGVATKELGEFELESFGFRAFEVRVPGGFVGRWWRHLGARAARRKTARFSRPRWRDTLVCREIFAPPKNWFGASIHVFSRRA